MKQIKIIALATLLVSQAGYGEFYSGNELLKICKTRVDGTNIAIGNACAGYVAGVADFQITFVAWNGMPPLWCIPEGVPTTQLALVVVQYLEADPAKLHLAASSLVANAFRLAFPCP